MTADAATFCPRCGDPVEPADVGATRRERSLCNDCYFEDFDLVDVPERITVTVCAHCGALHRGRRWVDVGARDYTDIAIEETTEALGVHKGAEEFSWQVDPEQVDETTIRMHCFFSGVVRGEPMTKEVTVPVRIGKQTCQRCGRKAGDYYASVVQIRGHNREPTEDETERGKQIANEMVTAMEATGDRTAFVTDVSEKPEGLNIKLSTTKLGKRVSNKLVEEFGGSVSASETLVTEDEDGNEVYRVTFAVRLPEFTPGTVIDPDDGDGPVLVRSTHGNLKGVRLATGETYEASFEDGANPDARKLGTRDDGETTTVVTVEDDHAVQLLDPETFEAKTVPRPDYFDPDTAEVSVFKSRSGLHVLPNSDA